MPDSSSTWLPGFTSALGPPEQVAGIGPGVWQVRFRGRALVVKVGPSAPDEADGLRQLAAIDGGPPVPEVVFADHHLLVEAWVAQSCRSVAHEEGLGRALAALHRARWASWGGGSGWIGPCRVDPTLAVSAADFYRTRLWALAGQCDLLAALEPVVDKLDTLIPPGRPSLVHGDLWWGNVVWGADGNAWLIDPSVHGGHPEEDLAMLGLFGPVPRRLFDAYCELRPLAEGWRERVRLFQLYPLLVHAVAFGGGYRSQAEAIARLYG